MPNGSLSRTFIGPIVNLPRTSERTTYPIWRRQRGPIRSTTKRGRDPST